MLIAIFGHEKNTRRCANGSNLPVIFFLLQGRNDPSELNSGLFLELAVHHAHMREALRARDLSGRHSAAN